MDAACPLSVSPDTLAALSTYLHNSGSALSLSGAATLAIRAWLACEDERDLVAVGAMSGAIPAQRPAVQSARSEAGEAHWDADTGASGYQWKDLFLPEGTEVRMRCAEEVHHARVAGDAILYQGRRVSPRQFTLAVAGGGRNAWRDLSLRLPGEKQFLPAGLLRRRAQAQSRVRADAGAAGLEGPGGRANRGSPADTIAAAAAAMSEALRAALALVEHSNAQSQSMYERRAHCHRRSADLMGDHVKFD